MAFVQKIACTALSSGTTLSGTITGVTAGNSLFLLAAYFQNPSTTAPSAPSDTNGTFTVGYAPTPAPNGTNNMGVAAFIELSAAAGSHTVALTLPSGTFAQGEIVEWSNIASATADQTNNTNTTTATSTSVSSGALAQTTEVAFVLLGTVASAGVANAGITDPPTGFISIAADNDTATNVGAEFAYKETSATTALSASWSWVDGGGGDTLCSQAIIATFKETSGVVPQTGIKLGIGGPGRSPTKSRFQQFKLSTVNPNNATQISGIVGAYSWAGTTATASALINADVGTYSWAGITSTASGLINGLVGAYSWNGVTAGITQNISAGVGNYTWSGTIATASGLIQAGVGAYSWSGTTSALTQNLISVPGSYSWSGTTAATTQLISASTGLYTWAASTSTLGNPINATVGSYTWSGISSSIPTQVSSDPTFGYVWSGTSATISISAGDTHDGGTQVVRESHYRKTLKLKKKGVQRQDLIDEEIARLIADRPIVLNKVTDDDDVITAYLTVESEELDQLTEIAGHLAAHLTRSK